MSRQRGDLPPDASAVPHALPGRALPYPRESLSTARHALDACSPDAWDWNMRSAAARQPGPMRSARLRILPASHSRQAFPSGMSSPCVEWRLLAHGGTSACAGRLSDPFRIPGAASVTLGSAVEPTARKGAE